MEASALPAPAALARTRLALGTPLLRLRSDEQLVSLLRAGSEEAFRAIHDRYRQRMLAYARQMLAGSAVDAEDIVQEVFVRAYRGLRANDRQLALRAWLYRTAHNRCIDELRRPQSAVSDELPPSVPTRSASDPATTLEQRDALRRLIADIRRLPDQQRSALLMRELAGMSYADVSGALGVTVPAVKSLLVRARVGLAQADLARDTTCASIRADLMLAHDRGVRASGLTRRHLRDCPDCRRFRSEVRGVSRRLSALVPAAGPVGVIAKLLGIGVGGAGGGGAVAGSGTLAGASAGAAGGMAATTAGGAAAGGVAAAATGAAGAGTGAAASAGAIASASHVVTILAAAVVTAGGAIELQHIAPPVARHAPPRAVATHVMPKSALAAHSDSDEQAGGVVRAAASTAAARPDAPGNGDGAGSGPSAGGTPAALSPTLASRHALDLAAKGKRGALPLTVLLNPDHFSYLNPSGITGGSAAGAEGTGPVTGGGATATGAAGATLFGGVGTAGAGASGSTAGTAGASAAPGASGIAGAGGSSTSTSGGCTSAPETATCAGSGSSTGAASSTGGGTSTSGASTAGAGGTTAAGTGTSTGTGTGTGTGAMVARTRTGTTGVRTGTCTTAVRTGTGTTAGRTGTCTTATRTGTTTTGTQSRSTTGTGGSTTHTTGAGTRRHPPASTVSGGASTTRSSAIAPATGTGSTRRTRSHGPSRHTGAVAVFTMTGA